MHSICIDSTYMITDKNTNRTEGKCRRKMLSENLDEGPRSCIAELSCILCSKHKVRSKQMLSTVQLQSEEPTPR